MPTAENQASLEMECNEGNQAQPEEEFDTFGPMQQRIQRSSTKQTYDIMTTEPLETNEGSFHHYRNSGIISPEKQRRST
jgi:hypothetical protein